MIKKNSENARIMNHFLNVGPLTAVEACQGYISNNLRSRVPELTQMGFDIVVKDVEGKAYKSYSIPGKKIEKNRQLFSRHKLG